MEITACTPPSQVQTAARPLPPVWAAATILFLLTFGVYGMTAERHGVNTDAYAAAVGAWRLASTGAPWLDGVDRKALSGTHPSNDGGDKNGTWLGEASNGHVVTQRMAGPILVGVPFYFVLDRGTDPHRFSIAAGGIAAAFVSALTVLVLFLTLRRHAPPRTALLGVLVFAFATPTWSVSANGLWTHTVTQFGIAAAAYGLSRERYWLAGLALGVAIWGRPHLALVAAVVGLGMALSQRRWSPVVQVGVPSALMLGLLGLWNRLVFGAWSIGGAYGDGKIVDAANGVDDRGYSQWQNYLGFWVAGDRGSLVWSPIVLVLFWALVKSWRSLPAWSRWLPVGGLLYTALQLRLNPFGGGIGFFGYRHGLELLTCLAPALVLSVPRMGRKARRLAVPVLAVQFAAFTLGAAVEGFFVPDDRSWVDNSFWLAVRYAPGLVGGWVVLCLALFALAASVLARRTWVQGAAGARVPSAKHTDTP